MTSPIQPSPADIIRMTTRPAPTARPGIIIGFDPDSRATAYAIADLVPGEQVYVVRCTAGGGTRKTPVAWQDVRGCLDIIDELLSGGRDPSELVVAVEKQIHGSTWAGSCELLWRMRYQLEAACIIRGVRCVQIDPARWMRLWVPAAFERGAGPGAGKKLYRAKGRELFGKLAANEDQAAALGITGWLAAELGCSLRGPL